jgi:hypothetical protein
MLYQSEFVALDGLKRPKTFDDTVPRIRLRLIPCFEDIIGPVQFYCGILLDTSLEFSLDKL